ncbi:WYL domain-containing protein [Compostibacter hankyongensis]|uniref:WYL domain-containing protein n=1 Tax=Compostibacter hankyongensis TaxID=1007089 RepID=A0ABP8GAS9_9BACT
MPVNKDAFARYRWIDERLRNKQLPKPTLEDLIEYVSGKMNGRIPKRTLQYDLHSMRYSEELNYKAPIAYHAAGKYYYYTDENYSISNMPVDEYDLQGLEIAIGILEQFSNLPMIRQFEDAIFRLASALKIGRASTDGNGGLIRLDTPQYQGLEWVQTIAGAMKQKALLRIAYQSFESDAPKDYWVEPYHLREYRNRFYLIGKSRGDKGKSYRGDLRTFGLDRIRDIWETDMHFEEKDFDEHSYFKHAVGITVLDEQPQKIALSFTPQQGKYIKSEPIHPSQKIIKDDEKECRVALELIINHELFMILLSYGATVEVLKPASLRERIKAEAAAMQKRYG